MWHQCDIRIAYVYYSMKTHKSKYSHFTSKYILKFRGVIRDLYGAFEVSNP